MGFCFPKFLFLLKKSYKLIKKLINFLSLTNQYLKKIQDLTMVPASDHIYCMKTWLGVSLNKSNSEIRFMILPCSQPQINILYIKTWLGLCRRAKSALKYTILTAML